MKILVSSEVFCQVKPEKLKYLEELQNSGSKYSFYRFTGSWTTLSHLVDNPQVSKNPPLTVWGTQLLRVTNIQLYNYLRRSIASVEHTDEYVNYLLETTFYTGETSSFNPRKVKKTPPGTLRFFSPSLVCFFNGKVWKRFEL